MSNYNLSSKSTSVSSYLIANKDYIADSSSKEDAIRRLKEVLTDCPAKKAEDLIKVASSKRNLKDLLIYVWNFILKGDDLGSNESEIRGRKRYH